MFRNSLLHMEPSKSPHPTAPNRRLTEAKLFSLRRKKKREKQKNFTAKVENILIQLAPVWCAYKSTTKNHPIENVLDD